LRKTNFPANNIKSATLASSSNGKKSISPDESFFDDILNFEEEEESAEDTSLNSPPFKSKFTSSKLSDSNRTSEKQYNSTPFRTGNKCNKELRRPFSSTQNSPSKSGSTNVGSDSLDTSGVKLSLFEFGHIRVQETRAELECDLADNEGLRLDLESGRVCFSCQNVRFRMLNWAYSCQFCKRNVCSNCYIKLRLPMEKLREVAVASLISQLTPLDECQTSGGTDSQSFMRSSLNRISLRRSSLDKRKISTPDPGNSLSSSSTYRPRMLRSSTTLTCGDVRGRGRGQTDAHSELCTVCSNCKHSLLQTIRSMSSRCRQSDRIIPGIKL